jgi:hypothetical protein
MKTLKQIREEYNDKYMSQVEILPEKMMLEDKGINLKNTIPSTKDMPSLLVFRRVSFRSYPKGQVVALYYSKLMDKYLSIPIGPGNSVNLSEAFVSDTLDEACWKGYQQYGMKKKDGKKVPNCVPVEEDGPVMSRYTERPTYEGFKNRLDRLREEKMDEGIVGDTIEKGRQWAHDKVKDSEAFKTAQEIGHHLPGYENVKAAKEKWAKGDKWGAAKEAGKSLGKAALTGGAVAATLAGGKELAKKALSAAGVKSDDKDSSEDSKTTTTITSPTPYEKVSSKVKHSSSWEKAAHENPVNQVKLRQAQLKENKITDIRAMVKEGIDNIDLSINGRSITLNTSMAKRILEVYDSVNTKNKKIVEGMLNEDLESFKKLLNFSIRN